MRTHSTENTASHVDKTDLSKVDQRTAPAGMAPDKAHAAKKNPGYTRETEQEETFDSSPSNAGSHQTGHKPS